jgi:Na+-translocating ferredoxin:NAD+ oxidoreductase RnfD subunit
MKKTSIWDRTDRLAGLRRFAIAISVLNILGHTILGFEQSWMQLIVALVAAYSTELLLEFVDARLNNRPSRFTGDLRTRVDFLLSAHISGLACGMLIYANDELWPFAFAAAVAIASKSVIKLTIKGSQRHFFNPSNLGITATLLLFPWIGVAQPYQFTEGLDGAADWVLPAILITLGTFLNWRFTKRLPLIAAWLGVFALQAVVRTYFLGAPTIPALTPFTGVAFLLYTFYMVTDPATTPSSKLGQIVYGASVAVVYSLLVVFHVVFGLFFALTIVCTFRGLGIYLLGLREKRRAVETVKKPQIEGTPVWPEPVMLVREEA